MKVKILTIGKGDEVKKILNWLNENLEEVLMVIALIAMTLIMGIQVFSRYVLGMSLSWSEELTRYIFIWSGFLSVSYCTQKCVSIKIEQFVAMFPRRGKAAFKVVNHTFELILFLYLLTPLLKKVLRVLPVWGVVAMMAVIFLGSTVAPFLNKVLDVNSIPVLPDGGVYFLYYLCGYFFAVREVCVDKGRNVWLTAAVAVLALGMILSRTLAGFSIQMAYNYPFTVLLAVLLFAAGWNGSIKKHRIPWQEAGALSFAVYLVHPVYVNLLYKFVKITPFTVLEQCGVQSVAAGQAVLILLLAAFCLVVLALATATAWVLRKIPVLRKYVL